MLKLNTNNVCYISDLLVATPLRWVRNSHLRFWVSNRNVGAMFSRPSHKPGIVPYGCLQFVVIFCKNSCYYSPCWKMRLACSIKLRLAEIIFAECIVPILTFFYLNGLWMRPIPLSLTFEKSFQFSFILITSDPFRLSGKGFFYQTLNNFLCLELLYRSSIQ